MPITTTLYDNTTNPNRNSIGGSPPGELGSEITLAFEPRLRPRPIGDFLFGYTVTSGVTGVLKFYMNDGFDGAPGTLFFESEPFGLDTGVNTTKTVGISHLWVPITFTWTVAYSGPADAGFGLVGAGPPTVGTSESFVWYFTAGAWFQQNFVSPLMARLYVLGRFRSPLEEGAHRAPIVAPPGSSTPPRG
jgi:hypothetical protein